MRYSAAPPPPPPPAPHPKPLTPDAALSDSTAPVPRPLNPPAGAGTLEAASTLATAAAPSLMNSAFLPVLIVVLAAGAWAVFQYQQLRLEAQALATMRTNQDGPLQQAERLRQGLDALAANTKRLADAGNPSARVVVEDLARRGVTITAQPAASAAK